MAVVRGRQITHSDLAEVADVTPRSLGEWMRGTSAPKGMFAVFNLLAALPETSVTEVLEEWREADKRDTRNEQSPSEVVRHDSAAKRERR